MSPYCARHHADSAQAGVNSIDDKTTVQQSMRWI
jgi:hypothetical protein